MNGRFLLDTNIIISLFAKGRRELRIAPLALLYSGKTLKLWRDVFFVAIWNSLVLELPYNVTHS